MVKVIIQVRGTSGSGKSTVVRSVMDSLGGQARGTEEDDWEPYMIKGRRKPLYYRYGSLVVMGHYESPCGGCDTVGSAAMVYEYLDALLKLESPKTDIVLCEGLLLSEDVKWSSRLPDLRVIFLTTPLDRCISQIKKRRKEAGNDKPLNTKNTTNRVSVIERARVRLEKEGVYCRRCSPEQAPRVILNWIRLHANRRK